MPKTAEILLPERHPTRDFFIADIFDALPIKNDRHTMEHPFFSLSTQKDIRTVEYNREGVSIKLSPSAEYGLPTMMDKDILLYCGSHIVEQFNKRERAIAQEAEEQAKHERLRVQGSYSNEELEDYLERYKQIYMDEQRKRRPIPKTIRFSIHDLMVTTNRETNGKSYRLIKNAFERLAGCLITTNVETNNTKITKGFHLIESFEAIEKSHDNKRMVRAEATISDWFYESLIAQEVLTINRDYFRLRKTLERRLYELARKHCGKQDKWQIKLANLYEKSGSKSPLKTFRFQIHKIIKNNHDTRHFPDYDIHLDANDLVTFTNREFDAQLDMLKDATPPLLKPETKEKAREIVREAGTGWDYDALEEQFSYAVSQGKFSPRNNDGAFIGFVQKKVREWA